MTPAQNTVNSPRWPIYVISLKDADARRDAITRQFQKISLDFTFFNAIDGRRALPPEYESWVDRDKTFTNLNREMSDGEYACAISHMSVYLKIISGNHDGAIILEDDAILTSLFEDFVKNSGYKAAPLVQLDHRGGMVSRLSKKIPIGDFIHLRAATLNPQLTTAYSISYDAANYILRNGLPLSGTADWPCDITTLPTLLATPQVVTHPSLENDDSTLSEQRSKKYTQNKGRWRRFYTTSYWMRWWKKRIMSTKIS